MLTPEQKKLVEDNIQLCYKFVRSTKNSSIDLAQIHISDEDAVSMMFIVLCRVAVAYNPDTGCALSTLAWASFRNACEKALKYAKRQKRLGDIFCGELDGPVYPDNPRSPALKDIIEDDSPHLDDFVHSQAQYALLRKIVNALPDMQRIIVKKYYWGGLLRREIAQELNVSNSTVGNALAAARSRIAIELRKAGYD